MRPRLIIFDLDGTLYRGSEPVPGATETVRALRKAGILIRFLTNNSSQHHSKLVEKLALMGFDPDPMEVYSTAIGAACWLIEHRIERAFVAGDEGLRQSLLDAHIEPTDDPHAEALVAGIWRTLDYSKLDAALQVLLNGAQFIATNTDSTYPLEGGKLSPGAGSMIAALSASAGRPPDVVIGKPEPTLPRWILAFDDVPPEDALMVGDRLETDILAGERAGMKTLLVLTGVAKSAPPGQWVEPSVASLRSLLDA